MLIIKQENFQAIYNSGDLILSWPFYSSPLYYSLCVANDICMPTNYLYKTQWWQVQFAVAVPVNKIIVKITCFCKASTELIYNEFQIKLWKAHCRESCNLKFSLWAPTSYFELGIYTNMNMIKYFAQIFTIKYHRRQLLAVMFTNISCH